MADLAIIVPTRYRANMLGPLVANLRETTETPFRIYFVCEESDTDTLDVLEQLADDDVYAVVVEKGSVTISTNAGYRASTEPYVFLANDDVHFHQGWDTAALAKFSPEIHIVGTNDGNGRCDCFFMLRRSYIRTHSGVFDQPDTVFHEYQHNWGDTELADYAKHRGVFAEATDSVTEHRHWLFGKADSAHPNYEKARETEQADHETYRERRKLWVG